MVATAQQTKYRLRCTQVGFDKTTLSVDGRVYVLVGDGEGNIRQVRGMTADPRVDEPVAQAVRGMPDWSVTAWPADYEPLEEVVSLAPGDDFGPMPSQRGQRLDMLSRLKAIGRVGQIEDPDYEVAALMGEVTRLRGELSRVTSERDEALAAAASLKAVVEAAGRPRGQSAALPRPDPEIGRTPPSAQQLGKGKSMAEELKAADIDPRTQGITETDDEGEPTAAPIAGALGGIKRKG